MHSRPVSGDDRFLDFVYGYVAQIADIDPTPMETVIYPYKSKISENLLKQYIYPSVYIPIQHCSDFLSVSAHQNERVRSL